VVRGGDDPGTANQYAIYDFNYPANPPTLPPVGTATPGTGYWGQLDMAGKFLSGTLIGMPSRTSVVHKLCLSHDNFLPGPRPFSGAKERRPMGSGYPSSEHPPESALAKAILAELALVYQGAEVGRPVLPVLADLEN
jgi:hypothetical protein